MEENKNSENKQKPVDEIDLINLFSNIGKSIKNLFVFLFKYLWIGFFQTMKFFYKNALYIGAFTVGGIGIGLLFFVVNEQYYASSMVATSNTLANADIISYIDNLDALCEAKDSVSLSQKLNIDVSETKKIKSIKALWAYDLDEDGIPDYIDYDQNFEMKDTSVRRIRDRFYVRAEVFDETVFSKLKQGLYYYIEQNPLVIEINNNRILQNKQLIAKIDEEIRKLDSLQKFEYFQKDRIVPKVSENQLVLFTEKDRRLYHNEIFELFKRKQDLEKNITVYPESMTVIEDFTPLSQVVDTHFSYMIRNGIYGFILGVLFRFFWLYGRRIHRWLIEE